MIMNHFKIIIGLALLMFSVKLSAQDTDQIKTFDSNFVHTVYFWLHNPDNKKDCNDFEASLSKFLQNSDFAKTKFIGKPPRASRDVVDGSFTYSLVVTFESAEAQQAYQDEAPNTVFIEESEHLWKKVIVYDAIEIPTE